MANLNLRRLPVRSTLLAGLALFIGCFSGQPSIAQGHCALTKHLCVGGGTVYCTSSTLGKKPGECSFDHPACAGKCNDHPGTGASRLNTDYSPVWCVGAPPAEHPNLLRDHGSHTNYGRAYSCLRVPAGKKISNVYCEVEQGPQFNPRVSHCDGINPGNGDSCRLGWSWAYMSVGNKLDDGSHVFCVHFFNESRHRGRHFRILAD